MEINKISSEVLSGNNSHFNAGIDESISTEIKEWKSSINELFVDILFAEVVERIVSFNS